MGTLQDDLKSGGYLDPQYGMVSNNPHTGPGPNCDNYFEFTAHGKYLGYVNKQAGEFVSACSIDWYPGLFSRWPGKITDISKDEMIGAAYLFRIVPTFMSCYGAKYFWSFNLQAPGKFSFDYWIGRYPDVAPYIRSRAGRYVWFGAQISWAVGCLISTLSAENKSVDNFLSFLHLSSLRKYLILSDASGMLLMLLQVDWMRKHFICRLAANYWVNKMNEMYPGGPKDLYRIYFGANHPFVKYAQEKFV